MFATRRLMRSVGDDADRANGVPGAAWTARNGAGLVVASNAFSSNAAGFFPWQYTEFQGATGPNQIVQATVAGLGSNDGYNACLFLRTPNSGTSGTWPCLFVNNKQMQIATMTSWAAAGFTARTALANSNGGANMALGGLVTLIVLNNVYSAFYNTTQVGTSWTDTTPVVPVTNYWGGLAVSAGGFPMPQLDNFKFGDF